MLAAQVQYVVREDLVYLVLKPGSQYWGLCIPRESENCYCQLLLNLGFKRATDDDPSSDHSQ